MANGLTATALRRASGGTIGRELGPYRLEQELARDDNGAWFVADDEALARRVALKVARPGMSDDEVALFLSRAGTQAKLQSPNVVSVLHAGTSGGRAFVAMELVDGSGLDLVVSRKAMLFEEEARRLMLHAARGLRDAHREGTLHGAIQPSVLLRDSSGWLKIASFGGTGAPPTGDSGIRRRPSADRVFYTAPEQLQGKAWDHRADMYSLACVFHHLLTARPPFDGTFDEVGRAHVESRPPRVDAIVRDVSPQLAAVVQRMLAKDPADRYPTWDDAIAALEAAAPRERRLAGFWARTAAISIDVALSVGLVATLGWVGLCLQLVLMTITSATLGQTLGKHLMHLQVQTRTGDEPGFLRSALRTLASLWLPIVLALTALVAHGPLRVVSALEGLRPWDLAAVKGWVLAFVTSNPTATVAYACGLVLTAFHPGKLALHDLLVHTEVVYRLSRSMDRAGRSRSMDRAANSRSMDRAG